MTPAPRSVPLSWWADEPQRLQRELAAMRVAAPELHWETDGHTGLWRGTVPLWPFDRERPAGVFALVGGEPLYVLVVCGAAYPMVEPDVVPLGLRIPWIALGWTRWHVLPNGHLCLLQATSAWPPSAMAAEIIPKVSGWYIEYHLMQRGLIEEMSPNGIADDTRYDDLLHEAP